MTGPLLTRRELYGRPWSLCGRDDADRYLAQDTLNELSANALYEAICATAAGQDWPDWVEIVSAYECERRDRRAVRRELREMAAEDGAR